jgi:hypothetical protein
MPKFFIFGDSHAGNLGRSAKSLGLDFAGGSIMAGIYLNDPFFKIEDRTFKMLSDLGVERLSKRLDDAGLGPNFLDLDMPILSTVGFNTNNFATLFQKKNLAIGDSRVGQLISDACFEAVVEGSRNGALEFYRAMTRAGKSIFAVLSPQRFDRAPFAACQAFEEIMSRRMTEIGVRIVDVRAETTDNRGILLPEYESEDPVHANQAYGAIVLRRFAEMCAEA